MEGVSFFLGVIGNIISIMMFLSPVGTFWRIMKRRSTEEFESLPYICTLLNSSLWTYYGIIKAGEYLVATVNGFGVLVETIYIILFLIYAPPKMKVKTGILVGILDVGFLAAAALVTQLALQGETRIDAIGFLGAGLNVVMYASPLAAMKTVVRTKSVEYMPFWLSLFLLLNGGVWFSYALLLRDWILAVPNGSGFLLGAAQLVLYGIYRDERRRASSFTKTNSSDGLEEGLQHQRLLSSSGGLHGTDDQT